MKFHPDSYLGIWKCVLIGAVLTAIVQSSSATLGITIALALTGGIDYLTAAALILGENIGTTITAFLASLGAFTNARRAAYAHVIFNVLGVCWITLLFVPYTSLVSRLITKTQVRKIPVIVVDQINSGKINDYAQQYGLQDALYKMGEDGKKVNKNGYHYDDASNTIIDKEGKVIDRNVWFVLASDFMKHMDEKDLINLPSYTSERTEYHFTGPAIAFTHSGFNIVNTLIFLPFIGLIAKLLIWLVPEKVAEKPRLTYLNIRMLDTPAIAIEQSYKELIKMGHATRDMMHQLKSILSNKEPDRQISEQLFQKENDLDVIQKEIVEFIGDMMAGNITHEVMQDASSHLRMADELESISDYILDELHNKVQEYIDLINKGIEQEVNTQEYFSEMRTKGLAVTKLMKESRERHLARVGEGIVSPLMSLIYTDMLTAYRRIKDHAFNIAEVLAGEK